MYTPTYFVLKIWVFFTAAGWLVAKRRTPCMAVILKLTNNASAYMIST
jgi:hypothetical protein